MKFLDNKWYRAESSLLKDEKREVPTNVENLKNIDSSPLFLKEKAYIAKKKSVHKRIDTIKSLTWFGLWQF